MATMRALHDCAPEFWKLDDTSHQQLSTEELYAQCLNPAATETETVFPSLAELLANDDNAQFVDVPPYFCVPVLALTPAGEATSGQHPLALTLQIRGLMLMAYGKADTFLPAVRHMAPLIPQVEAALAHEIPDARSRAAMNEVALEETDGAMTNGLPTLAIMREMQQQLDGEEQAPGEDEKRRDQLAQPDRPTGDQGAVIFQTDPEHPEQFQTVAYAGNVTRHFSGFPENLETIVRTMEFSPGSSAAD